MSTSQSEIDTIKRLASESLNTKWMNMDSLLGDACAFCKKSNYECRKCICPHIICGGPFKPGSLFRLGRNISKTLITNLWELPDWYITMMQETLKELSVNGKLSLDTETKIKKEIENYANKKADC